jgi:hypothetical protein
MHDTQAIKDALACYAQDLCHYLFPAGQIRYGKFYIGNLAGDPGKSLVINVAGTRIGLWKDFATGEYGSNLLDLLAEKNPEKLFPQICEDAEKWLNDVSSGLPARRNAPVDKLRVQAKTDNGIKWVSVRDLRIGSKEEIRHLARQLCVSSRGISFAQLQGSLRFFDDLNNGCCWSITNCVEYAYAGTQERYNRCYVRQDRRIDGSLFVLSDGSRVKARTIGCPKIPIGLPTFKGAIALCEGSSDFLAAFHLIDVEEMISSIAPVTMLGAFNEIHKDYLKFFTGKNIIVFPDYDSAGIRGGRSWEGQLRSIANRLCIYDYVGLKRNDGQPVKDLRDFLRVNVDSLADEIEVRLPFESFLSSTSNISMENNLCHTLSVQ